MRSEYYLKNRDELLKFILFLGLGITSLFEVLDNPENTIFDDPFCLGAFTMALASITTYFTFEKYRIDFTYPAMFIFIFSKLIAQYGHSKHISLSGISKHKDFGGKGFLH
jgi:hypothetical protein